MAETKKKKSTGTGKTAAKAASKAKPAASRPARTGASKPAASVHAAAQASPRAESSGGRKPKLWLVPVAMVIVLAAVGAFLVWHARYLASLNFDMVREAPVIPQGHDRGQGTGLANLAGDPQGHMFMLESTDGWPVRLQRFDQQNSPDTIVYKPAKPGEDLKDAVDVDCDPQGTVYVLLKDGRVQILDNDLKYLRTFQSGIFGGSALSVNSTGRIYIADLQDNKVVYFSAAGQREGEFGSPGKGDTVLVSPTMLRVTKDDEVVVVENTPTGLRGRIFTKDLTLRKSFLVDNMTYYPPVRLGVNSQLKAFFNDGGGQKGIVCWDLVTGKYFGAAQATRDGVQFVNPGCIGADRFTPDVYVHTVPGLIKCLLPAPGEAK